MGKSLLQIIAESKRESDKEKIVLENPYIENSFYKELNDDYGTFQGIDYSNDNNFPNEKDIIQIGNEKLADVKDFNVLQPQDGEYDRIVTNLNDSSVIDMPEIEEVSPFFWAEQIKYNKWVNLQHNFVEIPDAQVPDTQSDSYYDYIQRIKLQLELQNIPLGDLFQGIFSFEDTILGEVGQKALANLLLIQFQENLKVETLGRVNVSPASIIKDGVYYRDDFDITVPQNPPDKKLEFASRIAGIELPFSYLPEGMFGLERTVQIDTTTGSVKWVGAEMSTAQRIQLQLQYTGKGQQAKLIDSLKLNIYNELVEGEFETLDSRYYIDPSRKSADRIDNFDFVLNSQNKVDANSDGNYEAYGVVSTHLNNTEPKMFSDYNHWIWMEDSNPQATYSLGWTPTPNRNPYNPKSLLYKTQKLVNESSNLGAFLDIKAKSFQELGTEDALLISRGDATTASGTYTDDDGTEILKDDYFRVWTKQRGYTRLSRTLRHRDLDNGDKRSVLNDNGLINFAPTIRKAGREFSPAFLAKDDYIKRYMFSIENLAWNDHLNDLPECEQGLGDPVSGHRGRIMWFPPYDLDISEDTRANWETHQFIGRSEPIYTYSTTERTATLKFAIIVDYPAVVQQLVGERTEYWERYFKGDKLIEQDAIANNILKNRLSPNEIAEIEKRRKVIQPKVKRNDAPVVTPNQQNQANVNTTKEKVDDGSLGDIAMSVFFPNDVFVVPKSGFRNSLNVSKSKEELEDITSMESALVNPDYFIPDVLFLSDLRQFNVAYEDGKIASVFKLKTSDGWSIESENGLNYVKSGKSDNNYFTYKNGKVKNKYSPQQLTKCKQKVKGYPDTTNFGKNYEFFFQWQWKFYGLLKNAKKVRVTCVGNASAAIPTTITNYDLSLKRAENTLDWFKKFVVPQMRNAGLEIEYSYVSTCLSDTEDKNLEDSGADAELFCTDCDRADKNACKRTRRADIYIKILEENEPITPEPEDPTPPSTDDIVVDDNNTEDPDENDDDPDPNQDLPPLDPSIIQKLVYTECDFFEYLEINAPTQYQTISERIRYFHPAYHSMTPQGFNSRLTFLHQCLRQADSLTRDGVENFKNLAFGRPPVCILRIGDFYHTRCIIDNYSISYAQGMNWDMNPEGIGVQPMYADVTLSLKIIGGSTMTAPINRLQNALSFNYFANTEMYDGRADSVVFKELTDAEGNGLGLDASLGVLKSGQIIDGVKLSSITNFTQAEQQRRLANLRRQSRSVLTNSLTTAATPEQVEELGQVESLLEAKKRLGLPLTQTEKTQLKVSSETKDKFIVSEIPVITQKQITLNLNEQLLYPDSEFNKPYERYIEEGGETNFDVVQSMMQQLLNASLDDPSQITESDIEQITKEYLDSYNNIYKLRDYE